MLPLRNTMCARQQEADCVCAPLLFVYVLHRLSGVQKNYKNYLLLITRHCKSVLLTPLKNNILNMATRSVATGGPPRSKSFTCGPDHQLLWIKLSRRLTIPIKVRSSMYPVPSHAAIVHLGFICLRCLYVTLMCARQRKTDCVRAPLLFVYVLHRLSGVQKIIITTSNVPMRCHTIRVD